MSSPAARPQLDQAFERIEGTILPCLAMMLESLIDASAGLASRDPRSVLAELHSLAAELEELTVAVGRSNPSRLQGPVARVALA